MARKPQIEPARLRVPRSGPRRYRPQWGRMAVYAGVVVLALLLGAGLGGYGVALLSLPDRDGAVVMPGLSGPVSVKRDAHAIPRIEAQSMTDAYRVLGYVHAQDRMFQMEMTRRVGAGRLAELFGASVLRFDRLMRVLGLYRLAERTVAEMAPEPRAALAAYAAGVNHWIDHRAGPLPPEFLALRVTPEPWSAADSVVWGYLMALQLSDNWRTELARARLLPTLGPERLADLWPPQDGTGPTTLEQDFAGYCCRRATLFAELADGLPGLSGGDADPLAPGVPFAIAGASNEWALGGRHTATGAPLLANDPHLGFGAPIMWYLVEIVTPELQLTGATVPGVPLLILGHNGHIAWGFTTTHADVQDLFIERIDPADPLRYLTPDGSEPFALRREEIEVRGEDAPVPLTVRSTRHGPVISDVSEDAAALVDEGEVIALAFNALSDGNKTSEAIYRLNRAENWSGFTAALRNFHSPLQNVLYADRDGHIGFYVPGRLPVRAAGDGMLPVPGWTGEYDWQGYVPFDQLPHRLDPPSGRIVNANNRVVADSYPYLMTADWPDGYRAARIDELLAPNGLATLDDFTAMQMDVVSPAARDLLPVLLPLVGDEPALRPAVDRLQDWNGAMERDRAEPLIYAAWLDELGRRLYHDELGGASDTFRFVRPVVVRHMLTARPLWCDDATTGATETCEEIVTESLAAAIAWIGDAAGEDMVGWRWGDFHQARFSHQMLGRIPVVGALFDTVVATGGGDATVNRGTYASADAGDRFQHVHGAGFRAVYDLSNLARSRMMIATGQSGHPLSRHFDDLTEAWRDGAYLELGLRTDGEDGFPASHQTFRPADP